MTYFIVLWWDFLNLTDKIVIYKWFDVRCYEQDTEGLSYIWFLSKSEMRRFHAIFMSVRYVWGCGQEVISLA